MVMENVYLNVRANVITTKLVNIMTYVFVVIENIMVIVLQIVVCQLNVEIINIVM